MFWERDIETMPVKELHRLQLGRLQRTLRQARKSSAYAKIFKAHRVSPEKIKTWTI